VPTTEFLAPTGFVTTLNDCGYGWLLVQEHTVELPDGRPLERAYLPHRLVCTSSQGDTAEIVAVVKTQGSDTTLVGQPQPYYEAKGLNHWPLAGRSVPPLVTQIADGENGGVMMNEFPPMCLAVVRECPVPDTDAERHRVPGAAARRRRPAGRSAGDPAAVPAPHLRHEDSHFHVEGGSWTSDLSWVRGYDRVLVPMERASSLFHEGILARGVPSDDPRYRMALFHLLAAETSCYRYWGEGVGTDHGAELARRVADILTHFRDLTGKDSHGHLLDQIQRQLRSSGPRSHRLARKPQPAPCDPWASWSSGAAMGWRVVAR
jgi:hypothetical protein